MIVARKRRRGGWRRRTDLLGPRCPPRGHRVQVPVESVVKVVEEVYIALETLRPLRRSPEVVYIALETLRPLRRSPEVNRGPALRRYRLLEDQNYCQLSHCGASALSTPIAISGLFASALSSSQ